MTTKTYSTPLTVTETPFDTIALAFSGGGFRAVSFSLGVLSYFNELPQKNGEPLLHNVTYMSSASGGTITNGMYALNNAQGKDFGAFYTKLFGSIEGVNLLTKAMDILNDKKEWEGRPFKRRNLINAFSIAYDEMLFDGKLAGDLLQPVPTTHLEEVCFNAADFFRGLLFRQAIKLKPDSKADAGFLYGNFLLSLDKNAVHKIKLADMLTASSCFPGGFEPVVFPDDFANDMIDSRTLLSNLSVQVQELDWKESDVLFKKGQVADIANKLPKPVDLGKLMDGVTHLPITDDLKFGLMDGGISDNQGIESMMRANERRQNKETDFREFDLMLVSDVGSHFMSPYKPIAAAGYKGLAGLTIRGVRYISGTMALLGLAAIVYSFFFDVHPVCSKIIAIAGALILFVFGGLFAGIMKLKKFISGKLKDGKGLNLDKSLTPEIVQMLFLFFGSTPLGVLSIMMKDRVNSMLTLINDMFMKRIRQILYMRFLDDGHRAFRMKTNHLFDLSFANDVERGKDSHVLKPSRELQIVAGWAFEMATVLWFDDENTKNHRMAAVIACGQFTTCYNLLEFISRMKAEKDGTPYFSTLSPAYQENVNVIEKGLNEHYEKFKKDPLWLYNKLGGLYVTGFKSLSIGDFAISKDFEGLR